MLKCWFLKRRLFEYAIGELKPSETGKIKEHVRLCPRCRQYVARIQKIRNVIAQEEKPFLNEVFWRKFDERLALRLSPGTPESGGETMRMIRFKPLPRFALATAVIICILAVIVSIPLRSLFLKDTPAINEQELVERAILLEEAGDLALNHDEEAYIDEFLLQMEMDQV